MSYLNLKKLFKPLTLLSYSREILRIRGELGSDEDLEETVDDFEAPLI